MTRLGGAVVVGIVAGGLHALSLRLPGGWMLAWVVLVPLLRLAAAGDATRTVAATIAYALTLGQADVTPWLGPALGRYFGFTPAAGLVLAVVFTTVVASAYGAVLAAALVLRRRRRARLGIVWCAATWGVWESLRTLVPPWLPSCMLALSQIDVIPVLQLASVAGIAAVTALVVAGNAAIAELIDATLAPGRDATAAGSRPAIVRRLAAAVAVAVVGVGVVAWGARRAGAIGAADTPVASVVLVDGAARTAAESTVARYVAATPRALTPPPTFVIWPESALEVDLTRDNAAWTTLAAFVAELGVPLVTGGIATVLGDAGQPVRYNAVHFVRPHHGLRSYHKRWLVPLAESWPAWLGAPPAGLAPVVAGRELTLFGDDPWRFAPLVCSEVTDGGGARRLAALGARLLVSLNNDVWFAGAEAPHVVWARVRAVESGLAVARASNRGTSAVFDPAGRALALRPRAAEPGFVAAAVPAPAATVYGRTGEVFLPACVAVVLLGLGRRRRPSR